MEKKLEAFVGFEGLDEVKGSIEGMREGRIVQHCAAIRVSSSIPSKTGCLKTPSSSFSQNRRYLVPIPEVLWRASF